MCCCWGAPKGKIFECGFGHVSLQIIEIDCTMQDTDVGVIGGDCVNWVGCLVMSWTCAGVGGGELLSVAQEQKSPVN